MTMTLAPIPALFINKAEPLMWDVYDKDGRLLAVKGTRINDLKFALGMPVTFYYEAKYTSAEYQNYLKQVKSPSSMTVVNTAENHDTIQLFLLSLSKASFLEYLDGLYFKTSQLMCNPGTDQDWAHKVYRLAQAIRISVLKQSAKFQLALGVRRPFDYRGYAGWQAIMRTVFAVRIAQEWGASEEELDVLAAAALSADIGMFQLADAMAKQTDAPTASQKNQIANHARNGKDILKKLGVVNFYWLYLVENHHKAPEAPIDEDSQRLHVLNEILRLSDIVSARSSSRKDRQALPLMSAVANVVINPDTKEPTYLGNYVAVALGLPPIGAIVEHEDGALGVMLDAHTLILATNNSKDPRASFMAKRLSSISCLKPKPVQPNLANNLSVLFERLLQEYVPS